MPQRAQLPQNAPPPQQPPNKIYSGMQFAYQRQPLENTFYIFYYWQPASAALLSLAPYSNDPFLFHFVASPSGGLFFSFFSLLGQLYCCCHAEEWLAHIPHILYREFHSIVIWCCLPQDVVWFSVFMLCSLPCFWPTAPGICICVSEYLNLSAQLSTARPGSALNSIHSRSNQQLLSARLLHISFFQFLLATQRFLFFPFVPLAASGSLDFLSQGNVSSYSWKKYIYLRHLSPKFFQEKQFRI